MLRSLLPFIVVLPSLAYSLIALVCARRFFSVPPPRSPEAPAVTILKPVKGMDAGSYENFASFCRQEYAGPVQLLFAAASADDPVIPVIHRLREEFGGNRVALVINPAIHGPNYKVSNLINAFPQARHDIIIVCDSDIRVPPDYLKSVTARFSDPQVGLVTSLYRTSSAPTIATAIEATGFTAEMIPNVLVALQLEGLSFALGASMAVRREALASIGGFEALADYLADDYQLGNKVHRAGWRIALDGTFVESMLKAEDLVTVLARQLRWARTMRASRPGGYLASGMTLPFPGALLAAFVAPSFPQALVAIALLYCVRLAVTTVFSRRFVRDNLLPVWLWLIPLRDMLAFFTWALSFLGNRVEWRGSRFRLRPGGKIEELA
ncbi:bacteriohopanetetrol glucosamine biosynthesis glycosyltransferase HpnI [Oryzomonas rubra]|uniref:Glycosyltransferase n=1 Tax=Oryzomonas rubra TaxID=2509454 RepID=A0A5A9XFN5_9BACT|nr:bacteriohopanetetrol glucosamine biosynthesis glycosyltransferase HpnI [Oryzomonas rubra]KAA0891694.1 glycosyltransferase [Oryzomonas rubra]